MAVRFRKDRGFSLIELIVVIAIIGILSVVGVMTISGRMAGGVRSVMDELEGVLMNAQKATVIMSRDVYVSTQGDWMAGSLILDARPFRGPNAAGAIVVPSPPGAGDLTPGDNTKREGSDSECFRSRYVLNNRDHRSAGILTSDQEAWYVAARAAAPDLATVAPVNAQADFVAALGNRLFKGAASSVVVNGLTKRFEQGFSVVVVGFTQGHPMPNGPVGILVVPANSSSVYKFYKGDGESTWRRL